jgi:hypothetical protein
LSFPPTGIQKRVDRIYEEAGSHQLGISIRYSISLVTFFGVRNVNDSRIVLIPGSISTERLRTAFRLMVPTRSHPGEALSDTDRLLPEEPEIDRFVGRDNGCFVAVRSVFELIEEECSDVSS